MLLALALVQTGCFNLDGHFSNDNYCQNDPLPCVPAGQSIPWFSSCQQTCCPDAVPGWFGACNARPACSSTQIGITCGDEGPCTDCGCTNGYVTCPSVTLTCPEYAVCTHGCIGLADCLAACNASIAPFQCGGAPPKDLAVPDLDVPDLGEPDFATVDDGGMPD